MNLLNKLYHCLRFRLLRRDLRQADKTIVKARIDGQKLKDKIKEYERQALNCGYFKLNKGDRDYE